MVQKIKIAEYGFKRLDINPYSKVDDNLIDNPDVDADSNHYNSISDQINDYFDTNQLSKIMHPSATDNIHSINIRSLIPHIDLLHANLIGLSSKFCV